MRHGLFDIVTGKFTPPKKGISALKVLRAAMPGASDEVCDYVLWERTSYPFDGRPRTIYECARKWWRSRVPLCEFCDEPALRDNTLCKSCNSYLV